MDNSLFNFINGFANKWWPLDWLGIFFAEYLGYFLILIAVFLLIKEKNSRQRIYAFSLATLSVILARGLIVEIIRFFYERPRPFLVLEIQPLINHAATSSFPSGHAAAFFALALAIFYFLRQVPAEGEARSPRSTRVEAGQGRQDKSKWGWRCLILALLIGLARIFVGVHWPSDILAGALIGLVGAFLIKKILPK